MFSLPTNVTSNGDDMIYPLPIKHYYEYTTNFIKASDFEGLLDTEYYKNVDDTYTSITEARVSGSIKSYYVSGSPDTDNRDLYMSWSYAGNTLTDSYVTESVIYEIASQSFNYPGLIEINFSNDEQIYCGANKAFLSYSTASNSGI